MDFSNKAALVEFEIDRVLTQYRESPKLLHLARTYLGQVVDVIQAINAIPDYFDLDTAVGDQLTMLGKDLGWPREHCVCATQPVFGFDCDGYTDVQSLSGFCDGTVTWQDCGPFGEATIRLDDDEIYRTFLKVRRYQMLSLYDLTSLTEAVQLFWGPTASVLDSGNGRVVIAFGRDLSPAEKAILPLYPRVLPVAPGIRVRFHFDTPEVFGFGEGWLGFCQPIDEGEQEITTGDGETILVTAFSGPDKVINGTFDTDVSSWGFAGNGIRNWQAGRLRVSSDGGISYPRAYQSFTSLVIGKRYRVTFDATPSIASNVAITTGTTISSPIASRSDATPVVGAILEFTATATTHYLQLCNWSLVNLSYCYFDNVTLREAVEEPLVTGLVSVDPPWMCEIDVNPYDCNT